MTILAWPKCVPHAVRYSARAVLSTVLLRYGMHSKLCPSFVGKGGVVRSSLILCEEYELGLKATKDEFALNC